MTHTRLLAVDLDGTLVDSAPDLAYCVDRALESVGLPPPGAHKTRSWIGDGIETLLQRALAASGHDDPDARELRAVLEIFSTCYRRNLFVRSTLYPGVADTLDVLHAADIRLVCVTNKRAAFADALLVAAGIRDSFALVLGGDSLAEKKPSPMQLLAAASRFAIAPTDAAHVGDSYHDRHAAAAAGFRFIWARYGYCPTIQLPADATVMKIDRFADLRTLLVS